MNSLKSNRIELRLLTQLELAVSRQDDFTHLARLLTLPGAVPEV
jgi:hypothetical protein